MISLNNGIKIFIAITCFMLVWDVKEDRSSLPQASATKPGQEPLLIILLGPDNNINSLTVCSDGVKICQATALADGVLTLIAVYFLVNLNYPDDYSQLLGFIQLLSSNRFSSTASINCLHHSEGITVFVNWLHSIA